MGRVSSRPCSERMAASKRLTCVSSVPPAELAGLVAGALGCQEMLEALSIEPCVTTQAIEHLYLSARGEKVGAHCRTVCAEHQATSKQLLAVR